MNAPLCLGLWTIATISRALDSDTMEDLREAKGS